VEVQPVKVLVVKLTILLFVSWKMKVVLVVGLQESHEKGHLLFFVTAGI
jgi:hypothetical protein